jgi:hypothetical protein
MVKGESLLRTVRAIRYVEPLREGGSLPAIVEADDDGTYVLKFKGAGQGPKALVAELVAGEIGRALGLPVPEIVLVDLDPALGRAEPDFEIQALVRASAGINLALDFLPGSLGYDPLASPPPDPDLASGVVWFDAYVSNVDRTPRNPNILLWGRRLYLIDHGAALYFHHRDDEFTARSREPFTMVSRHVLLPYASRLRDADARLRPLLGEALFRSILAAVPDDWLAWAGDPGRQRANYLSYLLDRLQASHIFVEEAERARAALV